MSRRKLTSVDIFYVVSGFGVHFLDNEIQHFVYGYKTLKSKFKLCIKTLINVFKVADKENADPNVTQAEKKCKEKPVTDGSKGALTLWNIFGVRNSS